MSKYALKDKFSLKVDASNFKDGEKVNVRITLLDENKKDLGKKNDITQVKNKKAEYIFITEDIAKELNIEFNDIVYLKGWIDSDGDDKIGYNEEVLLEITQPEILNGFWLNENNKEITLSQEDTDVKIKINTSNVLDGTKINGKVLKSIFGFDKEVGSFSGEINNNNTIIDFKLDNNIVKDDSSEVEKLYFEVELEYGKKEIKKELPLKEDNYLRVVERAVLVSIFIEFPNHKSFNQKRVDSNKTLDGYINEAFQDLGLSGHSGIAIDGEYFDYGPNGSALASPGTPWWDSQVRTIENNTKDYNISDFNGKDVERIKKQMKNGIGDPSQPIKEVQILVTKNQSKILKKWWNNKYKDLGTYNVSPLENGEHCTSTVMKSLYKANIIGQGIFGKINYKTEISDPEEFYEHFLEDIKHTAGVLINGQIPNDLNIVPLNAVPAIAKNAIEIQIR